MYQIPLPNPSPNFHNLEKVLRGEAQPQRVYFIEALIDDEIIQYVRENIMNQVYVPLTEETKEDYIKQTIDFYYRMGYDCIALAVEWQNLPTFKERMTKDTAFLPRGQRRWVEEGGGIIKSWKDFERIRWDDIRPDLQTLDYAQKYLPHGMKVTVSATVFEMILERFLGYEDLFFLSHDDPQLVETVFAQWGQRVYKAYEEAASHPAVGAIFHADDLGYKTGLMMSPEFLRKNVFPWFKKYAFLAHEQGKMYWYHCCGNVLEVMEDLIEDVRIDAFHSFQDVIMPVGEFMKKYGNRIAALGGIDVDTLGRMSEVGLRKYVRNTLNECMPGRYALGMGNSVTNYVPPQNYLAMVEEGLRWRGD